MKFLKIFAIVVSVLGGILKLYFMYRKETELFKRFFNNSYMDRFLVILTGIFSILCVILGLMVLMVSERPFNFLVYATGSFFIVLASGLFFIASCNLWIGTIFYQPRFTTDNSQPTTNNQ